MGSLYTIDLSDGHCSCRSSDRTAVYVHELALLSREWGMPPSDGGGGDDSFHQD